MKTIKTMILLVSMLVTWQVDAAEFTGGKLNLVTPDGEMSFDLPKTGFAVADYTSMGQAPSLIVKSFEASATGNVNNATLVVAMYKQGKTPTAENWREIPLTNAGNGKWSATIGQDLVEAAGEAGNYTLEMYVKGQDVDGSQLLLNNGGQNYIVKFALGASGSDVVHWLTTGTAEVYLTDGANYLQYRYNGDYTRDNTTMPGAVDMLAVNFFSIYYDLAAETEIKSASMQYMIYPEGGRETEWNTIECNEVNTLVSSRKNTHKSTFNEQRLITCGLEPGNYVLRIMFQLIDGNGNYHFFGKENENGNFVFNFSINEPQDPDILGISMVVTPTPGEQQYPWAEAGEPFETIDLTNDDPIKSMTCDEVFIFAQGNFNYVNLVYLLRDATGNEVYRDYVDTRFDDFGNWSNEQPFKEMLISEMLENGKTYRLEYWAEGLSGDEMYYLNNGGYNYPIIFVYGTGGSGGVKGDVSGDGIVDVTDVSLAIDMVLGKAEYNKVADLDQSGQIDVTDVSMLIDIVLGK